MGIQSPGEDAFMEWPGIDVSGIGDSQVRRALATINDYFKRGGVFADQDAKQTEIDTNEAAIVLNTNHRGFAAGHTDVVLNNTHRASSGVDHTYIDQDVREAASVQFAGLKFGASGQQVTEIDTNTSLGASDTKLATQNAIKAYVDAEVAAKMDDTLVALQALNTTIPNAVGSVGVGELYREAGGDCKWRVS